MNYDEFEVGQELPEVLVEEVRKEDMKMVTAILQDPNPIHYDELQAADQGRPLINQGPVNISYVIQSVLKVLDSPAHLHSVTTRLQTNVYEGETVRARATVTAKRERDHHGVVEFDIQLVKQGGEVAITGTAEAHIPF